jgi:hypothetical protein
MNHKAVYKLYSNVVSIYDASGAFDADGNQVTIDIDAVNAWVDPDAYKYSRAKAYPTIQEQLDMQYWDGVNGTTIWADTVASVKSENPKP